MSGSIFRLILLLILSFVVTYVIAIAGFLLRIDMVSSGLPLEFDSSSGLLSSTHTDYLNLILDVIFWSIIIYLVRRFVFSPAKKK